MISEKLLFWKRERNCPSDKHVFPDCLCWLPETWRTPGRRTTTGGVQGECSRRLSTPRLSGPDRRVRRGDRRWVSCTSLYRDHRKKPFRSGSFTFTYTDFSCWRRSRACWWSHVLPDRTRFTHCISHILIELSPFRDTEQNNRCFNTQILWNRRCSSSLAALSFRASTDAPLILLLQYVSPLKAFIKDKSLNPHSCAAQLAVESFRITSNNLANATDSCGQIHPPDPAHPSMRHPLS